ncbi:monovalent cation/H(+) antiporter subunit G [Rubellimicrobium mesophilum]|uniref:monovalent cation/H(+) antiporter subunit G n=1 Tax=Rubellimicrobium mesophilum TaxID=1123067 RepID=UPI00056AABAC|nr:monovalent cation/H(+) antiporter subunit G [Rubellimicrobium mesophilum]
MRDLIITVLLVAAVVTSWLGTVGFVLLKDKFDRLHSIGFVTVVSGFLITVAAVAHEPLSALALKQVAFYVAALTLGGVLTHAIARSFRVREESTD